MTKDIDASYNTCFVGTQPDAELCVSRELVTAQHLRPGIAVLKHAVLAA